MSAVTGGKLPSVANRDRSGKLIAGHDAYEVGIGGRGDRLLSLAVDGAQDGSAAPNHPADLGRRRGTGKEVAGGATAKRRQ